MNAYEIPLESLPVPALIIDIEGNILDLNPAAIEHFDLAQPGELIGRHIGGILDALDSDPWILPERTQSFRTFLHIGTRLDREVKITLTPLKGVPGRWLVAIAPPTGAPDGFLTSFDATLDRRRYGGPARSAGRETADAELAVEIIDAGAGCPDDSSLSRTVSGILQRTIGVGSARVFLYESERSELRLVSYPDDPDAFLRDSRRLRATPTGRRPVERALFERRIVEAEDRDLEYEDGETAIPIHATASAPLVWEDESFGALVLFDVERRPLTETERRRIETIARYAAGGFSRLRDRRLALQGAGIIRGNAGYEALARMDRAAFDGTGPEEILAALVDGIAADGRLEWIIVAIADETGRLIVRRSVERTEDTWEESRTAVGTPVDPALAAAFFDGGTASSAAIECLRPASDGAWTVVAHPLAHGEVRAGVALLGVRISDDGAADADLAPIRALLDHAACAIVHARRAALLREIERARVELIATVATEIRDPVRAILGSTDALLATPRMTPRVSELAEQIRDAGRNLDRRIDALAEIARLDVVDGSGTQRVSVGDILDEVERITVPFVDRNTIAFAVEAAREVREATIEVDRAHVAAATSLLARLAARFTERGDLGITATIEESSVRIAIADADESARPDGLPALFAAIARRDADGVRRFGGAGLAFALARYLVELHGGFVAAESLTSRGGRFSIVLPRREMPAKT